MSQLYTLTKQINDLLPKVASKYDLKINVENDSEFYQNKNTEVYQVWTDDAMRLEQECGSPSNYKYTSIKAIQAPQIRQILLILKDVLGKNPNFKGGSHEALGSGSWHYVDGKLKAEIIHYDDDGDDDDELNLFSYAESLCGKCCDGLTPLIDTNQEQVLSELVEVLENLLK